MDRLLLFFFLVVSAFCSPPPLAPRGLVPTAEGTYDYIVVGCGVSGLVVSMRLSEESNVTVLCLEAGQLDHYEEFIQFPVFIGKGINSTYDWNISTVPQYQLDGGPRDIPMGKGVGGGSLINGMVWNRGNQADFDAWESFGNPGWSWSDLLPYFIKSETYTPRTYPGVDPQPVQYIASYHGFSGPVQVSYPEYYWSESTNFFEALNELGVPTLVEPNAGLSAGGFFAPCSVEPVNQTRSDARTSYYDPYSDRTNFNVAINSQVTRILFSPKSIKSGINNASQTNLIATGVEYASDASAPRQTVYASREVILAAGAVHSPQLLQLSGIGQPALLDDFGIEVLIDLPGVGNNLQDHPLIHLDYSYEGSIATPYTVGTNETYNEDAEAEFLADKTGPWAGRPSAAIAFPSLPQIIDNTASLIDTARQGGRYYPSTYESTLKAGYEIQFDNLLTRLLSNTTPAYENLNNDDGGLDVSLQHPLSRGTVQIASTDPFETPLIDPRWLTNPFDEQVLVAAMQFNQKILDTSFIQALVPSYWKIPENLTPAQAYEILIHGLQTEFHYSGTTALLPLNLGGVVDPNLVVYGTENVRVIDTGVFPVVPAAHLQAVVYGVAEKAADLIKAGTPTSTTTTQAAPTGKSQVPTGRVQTTSAQSSASTSRSQAAPTGLSQRVPTALVGGICVGWLFGFINLACTQ